MVPSSSSSCSSASTRIQKTSQCTGTKLTVNRKNHNSYRVLFDKIAADNFSLKIIPYFALGMAIGQYLEPALPIVSTHFSSRCVAVNAYDEKLPDWASRIESINFTSK